MRRLNVLIACEESQAECIAFRELGCNAYSCDIQPCRRDGHPEWHIQGDVIPFLDGLTKFRTQAGERRQVRQWDLIVAHPPCTYLCRLSGVLLKSNADWYVTFNDEVFEVNFDRYQKLKEGRAFFMHCLNAKADYLAVENPVPLRIARLPRPSAFVDPSWFGVKYTKKTCYWLRNLPPPMAEIDFPNPKCFVHCSRGKYRSRTFPAMARAIARQWLDYINNDRNKQTKNK
jgi:hypothetical protein